MIDEVSTDLLDMFESFNDFSEFKSLMLSFKGDNNNNNFLVLNGISI